MSRYTAETATAELAEASERAELPVREVTGLADGLPVPAADVLDRAGWITAASRSMAHLTGADPDGSGNLIVGKPAGLQAGAMLAYLSSAILGQYDPFTRRARHPASGHTEHRLRRTVPSAEPE